MPIRHPEPDVSQRRIEHQRKNNRATRSWACVFCPDRKIFLKDEGLWKQALLIHADNLPDDDEEPLTFRRNFAAKSSQKTTKTPSLDEGARIRPEPPPSSKRPLVSSISFVDPSNIASVQAQKARVRHLQPKPRQAFQAPPPVVNSCSPTYRNLSGDITPSAILSNKAAAQNSQALPKDETYDSILQPETRPISQEQLVAEVKGIYAGLVMVEAKCIEIDNKQATLAQAHPRAKPKLNNEQWQAIIALHRTLLHEHHDSSLASDPGAQPKLNNEQWQAIIARHRTLLHEHHDFFLASQHPSPSPAMRHLAAKYAMPARMWRHGIHSFLELSSHGLPASLDHMLAFIYFAYSMMALLYETVPAFEDTWIECLGDLGCYRMVIEDDDIRDREVWMDVARHWYSKASDKPPTTGILYHHLAILAKPNALQQLFYYAKSLCVVILFSLARESILTLFEPVLKPENGQYRLPPLDTTFVKAHGPSPYSSSSSSSSNTVTTSRSSPSPSKTTSKTHTETPMAAGLLFTNRDMEKFEPTVKEFLGLLDDQIGRVTREFMEQGYYIAVANSVAILGFASKDSVLMQAICHFPKDEEHDPNIPDGTNPAKIRPPSQSLFCEASRLSNGTLRIVLQRIGGPNVLPFIHVTLVFLLNVSHYPAAMGLLQADFPWELLSVMLNTLMASYGAPDWIEDNRFPLLEKADVRPFPEDFAMRGLLWSDSLDSLPFSKTRRKTPYTPRVPTRYYDGVKKMNFAFRDSGFEQCAKQDHESQSINSVRRIFGSGLSDEQSSPVAEALIQAYSELLGSSDLVCMEGGYSSEGQRHDPIAPDSQSHPPPLAVPEASAAAKPDGVFPLQNLLEGARGRIMRILSLLVDYPLIVRGLYCCHQAKGVIAEPTPAVTSSASVLTSGIHTGLDWFSEERPAVVSTGLLLGTTLWLVSGDRWKDSRLLPNLTAATTVLVFYLTMDDTCWPGQLAIAAAFGVYLDFLCVQRQTALLEKTWAMTFVGVLGTGMLASLVVAYYNDFVGKYAHPAILAGSVCLPVTASASVIWYAFVKCTGVAENLERGDYNGSIFAFLSNFVYNMFVAILEAMLESLERRRERRRRA